jgi:hypothetical protein
MSKSNLFWLGVLVAFAACTKPNPKSCADDFCDDPAFPFCDTDGSISGAPGTCVAVGCTPLEFEECRGDQAVVCAASGDDFDLTNCEFGCDETIGGCKTCVPGTPGCDVHIVPRYVPTACDAMATEPTLEFSGAATFDTDADASCNGGVITQAAGPQICVARYGAIQIKNNTTVTVIGKRALALVADTSLDIQGTLDVSANAGVDGPGGGVVKSGSSGGDQRGGGGAGFRTKGGSGGSATADGGAGNGGAITDPTLLVELVGGNKSTFFASGNAFTGGAGGAATLVACRGAITVGGTIDAGGGGGGGGGVSFLGDSLTPGGGGSGGHVVFQGLTIRVTGNVFANGGGGGSGLGSATGFDRLPGATGDDGTLNVVAARGGAAPTMGGRGGDGGIEGVSPQDGKRTVPEFQLATGGAGGGSVGFFEAFTPPNTDPELNPFMASPSFLPPGTIPLSM